MTSIDAYSARAREYAELLGTIEAMAPADRRRIESWAATVDGPLLDAGCGPGHWTAHLARLGYKVQGMDPVPEFIDLARRAHPEVAYRVGAFADVLQQPGVWGGILAWYSLIHLAPAQLPGVLATFHKALRPAGRLLLGFFEGPVQEPFDHVVATAQFWPTDCMVSLLEDAGFRVLDVERRHDFGSRPHAGIGARRL